MSQTDSSSMPSPAAAPVDSEGRKKFGLLAIGGLAGVFASLCCVGPLVAVSLGLGGAVAAAMVAFEPLRPVLIPIALGALGYAGWRIHRKPSQACAPGEVCVLPATNRVYKIVFWLISAAVLALIAAPFYAPLFY